MLPVADNTLVGKTDISPPLIREGGTSAPHMGRVPLVIILLPNIISRLSLSLFLRQSLYLSLRLPLFNCRLWMVGRRVMCHADAKVVIRDVKLNELNSD